MNDDASHAASPSPGALNRTLLLVAYHFPPVGGSGVQRPLNFAKYLPHYGWRPIVLCAGHDCFELLDPSLCDEIPREAHVERLAGLEPAALAHRVRRILGDRLEQRLYWRLDRLRSRLPIPEEAWLWSLTARRRARQLVKRFHIDAVMTTGGPFSTHRIGLHLKRRLGLPWLAEFRDPLTDNFAYAPRSRREDRGWRRLERDVADSADALVVTCPEYADVLRGRFPDAAQRITTITNGFDPADFDATDLDSAGRPSGEFVLTHVGAFYRQQSIEPILAAFRALLGRRPDWLGRVWFDVVGSLSAEQTRLLRDDDRRFLRLHGYQPHAAAVATMRRASALYLTAPDTPGGRLCIPAKTYEYLASGRPILATVPAGTWLEQLLERAGGVCIARRHDPAALSMALERFIEATLREEHSGVRDSSLLQTLRRDVLTASLSQILNRLMTTRRASLRGAAKQPLVRESFLARPIAGIPSRELSAPPAAHRRAWADHPITWQVPALRTNGCGASRRTLGLAAGMRQRGLDVRLTVYGDKTDVDSPEYHGVPVRRVDVPSVPPWHWSLQARTRLTRARRLSVHVPDDGVVLSSQPEFAAAALRGLPDRPVILIAPSSQLLYDAVERRDNAARPLRRRWAFAVNHRMLRDAERRGMTAARAVVFNSRMCRDAAIRAHGLRPERCHVIPPSVDVRRFCPADEAERAALRREFDLPSDGFIVCWSGRMDDRKNVELLIDAVSLVRDDVSRLVLLGDGPLQLAWRERADRSGLSDRVIWPGLRGDVERWLRACDLFVLPSLVESCGNAVIEAMASGLPCVSLGFVDGEIYCGAEESIVDGETGFVVRRAEPAALAAPISMLAADAQLCRRMGAAGRDRALAEYAAGRDAEQLERILNAVCA